MMTHTTASNRPDIVNTALTPITSAIIPIMREEMPNAPVEIALKEVNTEDSSAFGTLF